MAKYKELEWLDEERKFKKVKRLGRFGIKKTNGGLITKIKYKKIYPFVDGVAGVMYQRFLSYSWVLGIVTKEGREFLFDEKCVEIVIRNKNVIAVKMLVDDGKYEWAIFNSEGIEPYGIRYDTCPQAYVNGRSKVVFRGKYTFLDERGKQICGARYDNVADFRKNGRAFVWIGNTRCVLLKNGCEEHVNMKRI